MVPDTSDVTTLAGLLSSDLTLLAGVQASSPQPSQVTLWPRAPQCHDSLTPAGFVSLMPSCMLSAFHNLR